MSTSWPPRPARARQRGLHDGQFGRELTISAGTDAARLAAGLCCLSTLRAYLGTLDTVTGVVRVVGFINCAPGFNTPSDVLHGFSDLMIDIFGDAVEHVRMAIGVAQLYADIPVEVEALFEVAEGLGFSALWDDGWNPATRPLAQSASPVYFAQKQTDRFRPVDTGSAVSAPPPLIPEAAILFYP